MSHSAIWLDPQQQRIWRDYLRATAKVADFLDARLRAFGLDLGEYEIFVALSEAPNRRLRMSDLADAVHQSRSRLTHAVARLERAGLVRRVNCPSDRRGVNAVLTDDGMALLQRAAPDHVAAVREAFVDAIDAAEFTALGAAMSGILAGPAGRPQSSSSSR